MNENKENELRGLQLEFCGRLLAGFTHDLKNHLAIIKEFNGLISDMIDMGMVSDEMPAAKLRKIAGSIQGRVEQATEMATHLNGFAHRLDTPLSTFQVNDLLTEELTFLRRFARLREIELRVTLREGLPAIHNNASLVQFVVFRLFSLSLKRLRNKEAIEIVTGAENGGVTITFVLNGEQEPCASLLDDETAAAIREALGGLQGKVAQLSPAGTAKAELRLFVPSFLAHRYPPTIRFPFSGKLRL